MFRIDDHIGIAIAGLTSDARVLRSVQPISLGNVDVINFP
jgi:Proteasome subunit